MTGNQWKPDSYIKAYRFALEAHNGQLFQGTDLPYIMHVTYVAMELQAAFRAESGHDEDYAMQCALLHDVIEDTAIDFEQIREKFGLEVAQGVMALTKDESLDKAHALMDSVKRIKLQCREIWMVKLADRITNLQRPPLVWDAEKIEAYKKESAQILYELGPASEYLSQRLKSKIETYGIG